MMTAYECLFMCAHVTVHISADVFASACGFLAVYLHGFVCVCFIKERTPMIQTSAMSLYLTTVGRKKKKHTYTSNNTFLKSGSGRAAICLNLLAGEGKMKSKG